MDFFDESDLDDILEAAGEDIILAGQQAKGIYDSPFQKVDLVSGAIENYAPKLTVKSSLVAALVVTRGTEAIVPDGIMYVDSLEPERKDGKGFTALILTEEPI